MTVEDKEKNEQLEKYKQEIIGLSTNRSAGELPIDLRLEVILAELAYQDLDPLQDVLIHSWSLFERDYRNDVDLYKDRVKVGNARSLDELKELVKIGHIPDESEHIKLEFEDYDDMLRQRIFLNLIVHRDGLYDYLPEGLFHQPVNKTRDRDQSDWAVEVAEQFRREQAARRFFQPIEQEFFHQRLFLEFEERKYLLTEENLHQNDKGEILREFWQLPADLLSIRQLANLLHLLPIAYKIAGNMDLVTQVFRLLLGVKIDLTIIAPIKQAIKTSSDVGQQVPKKIVPESDELGRIEMGNFSLGGIYQDSIPALQISIGPLTTDQLIEFLPDNHGRILIDILVDYFIPAEMTVVTHLIPDARNKFLTLKKDMPTSVLGHTTYLGL